ncbi:MAG: tetratricopeptide repeat protein [Muribaculaceae bacterium]|nr:tetratricopeptide repeat protein [Muribaculaceae bacterium]
MASNKDKHQDETAIDRMNSHLTDAGSRVAENKKIILWAVGIILVVAAFVLSYLFIYKNPHVEKAFEAYNGIETQNLNDSTAAQMYMDVADQYNGDAAGKLAALSAGETLYNQGRYEEAAQYLKKFSSGDSVLEANALVLTGDCYVNLENYDEAISYYQKAIRKAENNPQIVPRVLLKEANVYDAQGNYGKALECYQEIKNNYPQFQLGNGMDMEAYIARELARMGNPAL